MAASAEARSETALSPPSHIDLADDTQVHVAESGKQVVRQQATVQLLSPRLEHVIVDPALRVVKEPNLPRVRVYPVTTPDLSLFHGEPYLGITLGPERLRGRPVDTIRSSIADLIPARGKTPDSAKPRFPGITQPSPETG